MSQLVEPGLLLIIRLLNLPGDHHRSQVVIAAQLKGPPDQRAGRQVGSLVLGANADGLLVIHDIPDAVAGKHQEPVLVDVQFAEGDLGHGAHQRSGDACAAVSLRLLHQEVPESTGDGEAPEQAAPPEGGGARREDPPHALHVHHPPAALDTALLVRPPGLVVLRQPPRPQRAALLPAENCAGVSQVGHQQPAPGLLPAFIWPNQAQHHGGAVQGLPLTSLHQKLVVCQNTRLRHRLLQMLLRECRLRRETLLEVPGQPVHHDVNAETP
mmetsp:Transcript_1265/g.2903  ORF Transcript_1265/g.2903 Transcript_1265/m.2903 type:complete len:269 (-) Transcript_1265:591-1397(-)